MEQVADAIRDSVRGRPSPPCSPAIVEAGEILAREHNRERRSTYRSAEEAGLSWFRALDAATGETIATVGAYAAHPTTSSWAVTASPTRTGPGCSTPALEERFGGIGLHFMTGLGNMSPPAARRWSRLADLIPEIGEGRR
jgi:hypothetical protein